MKKIAIFFIILIVAGAAILFFHSDFFSKLPQVEKGIYELLQETKKQVFLPIPLIAEEEAKQAFLTQDGVIALVNQERAKEGLPALKESQLLDESAAAKVSDMFKNQYFAHDSPAGLGVGDLAEAAGYDYLNIGENLAMGNFEDDATLVKAWMNSEGHRANILDEGFQEIGVSVQKGIYQGRETWFAVQHFAKPLSACPQPDSALKIEIESNKNQLSFLQEDLEVLRAELQTTSKKDREDYNQKVAEYNALVEQYNNLVAKTKNLVATYNKEVQAFNSCARGN